MVREETNDLLVHSLNDWNSQAGTGGSQRFPLCSAALLLGVFSTAFPTHYRGSGSVMEQQALKQAPYGIPELVAMTQSNKPQWWPQNKTNRTLSTTKKKL